MSADRIINTLAAASTRRTPSPWTSGPTTVRLASPRTVCSWGAVILPGSGPAPDARPPTAKLPRVDLEPPTAAIEAPDGAAQRIFYGAVDAIDGIVRRIKEEWGRRIARRRHGRIGRADRTLLPDGGPRRTVPDALRPRLAYRYLEEQASSARVPQSSGRACGDGDRIPTTVTQARDAQPPPHRLPPPGEGFSYILHLRPRGGRSPALAVGILLATGWSATAIRKHREAAAALVLWVIALNGGTLAVNSAFDDDDGDIGYLEAPPKPPRHLAAFSIGLMASARSSPCSCALFAIAYAVLRECRSSTQLPPSAGRPLQARTGSSTSWGFGRSRPSRAGRPPVGLESLGRSSSSSASALFAGFYPSPSSISSRKIAGGDRTLALVLGIGGRSWCPSVVSASPSSCSGRPFRRTSSPRLAGPPPRGRRLAPGPRAVAAPPRSR